MDAPGLNRGVFYRSCGQVKRFCGIFEKFSSQRLYLKVPRQTAGVLLAKAVIQLRLFLIIF